MISKSKKHYIFKLSFYKKNIMQCGATKIIQALLIKGVLSKLYINKSVIKRKNQTIGNTVFKKNGG